MNICFIKVFLLNFIILYFIIFKVLTLQSRSSYSIISDNINAYNDEDGDAVLGVVLEVM